MNARLIKAATRENAASVALNHQEQPHFSALCRPDQTEIASLQAQKPRGNRADTLTRPDSKRPTAPTKTRKEPLRKIQVRSSPFSCTPWPKPPGECASSAFHGKAPAPESADAKQSSWFSAPVYRVRRAKRPTASTKTRKEPLRKIQVRSSPFSCTPWPKPPGECASSAFRGKTPAPEPADAKQRSRFSAPVYRVRRAKRPYNTDKNAKRAAAENPSPQQPPFLRPTAESAGRMRFKRLSGKNARARAGRCETEQPVFSARLPRAARPSEAACRTPAPRAPSSRRFDIRADWA